MNWSGNKKENLYVELLIRLIYPSVYEFSRYQNEDFLMLQLIWLLDTYLSGAVDWKGHKLVLLAL